MDYKLRDSFGFRINQAANKVHAMFSRMIEAYAIAPEQFAAMMIISEDSEAKQSTIVQMLGKGKPTISRTLDALEKKGLVFRDALETDRRAKRICLTAEGKAVLNAVTPYAKDFNSAIRERIEPQEAEIFFKVLETILEIAEQYETKGEKENEK
jgi:DNA-binding MarR family transcriptional regulator